MAFEKIVTEHGNFAEVTRKAVNAANQIRSRMFGKINPQDRVKVIREYAEMLLEYADCLDRIWKKEQLIQAGEEERKPYENISKRDGDGEGSREGSIRNGDQVSEQDGTGSGSSEGSEIPDA